MIPTLMLISFAIACGTLITYLYDSDAPLFARINAGVCIGFATLGLIAFYYALFVKLTALDFILTIATLGCSFLLLLASTIRSRLSADVRSAIGHVRDVVLHPVSHKREVCLAVLYILFAVALERFFGRAVFEFNGMILTGAVNNIGDLPLHTSMISSFAFGENFPPEHPQFAGSRLTYPFLADFLTAFFMRAGVYMSAAMYLQTVILMLALIGVAYRWALTLTRDTLAAVLSVGLLLFSGGFGFWLLRDDVQRMGGKWAMALMNLGHEYTTEQFQGFRWGNMLEAILLPQRSFQMGLPLSLLALTLWWQAMGARPDKESPEKGNWLEPFRHTFSSPAMKYMLGAGFIIGLLPLIHTTTFLVLMCMASCLALLLRPWQRWAVFFAAALLVSVPQVLWFGHGSAVRTHDMFAWSIGWDRGNANFWWFWLKNTGIFIPMLLIALVWAGLTRSVPRRLLLFYLPFLLCFIVPNLFRLMPWIWDNIKALIYWYIASVPLVALLLARLWRKGWILRPVVLALFLCMTAAGALDVWRVLAKFQWVAFDRGAVNCANTINKLCPPRSVVLHAPLNNSLVYLTGRRSLMSIPFMAWVHGLSIGPRESDIRQIYTGAPAASDLIAKYEVDYAVLGPPERNLMANESFLARFPVVADADGYRIYKLNPKAP